MKDEAKPEEDVDGVRVLYEGAFHRAKRFRCCAQ